MIFGNIIGSFCVALFLTHLPDRIYGLTLSQNSPARSDHVRRQGGGCKTYMMVGARGTTERQGHSVAYSPMAKKVLAAIPGGAIHDIKYSSSAEYVRSPKEGAQTGLKFIKQQIASCPNMVFVLMGYSKGAMVASQILADKGLPPNKVVAVALFGNPYYKGGAPQNKCSAKSGKGIASMMMVKVPEQYVPAIWDCCLTGDMICQTSGSIVAHLKYTGKPASDAEAFIVSKLKGGKVGGGGAGSGKAGAADADSPPPKEKKFGGGSAGTPGGMRSMLFGRRAEPADRKSVVI